MTVKCDYCNADVKKKPSDVKKLNFCNKTCRHRYKHVVFDCVVCGIPVERLRCINTKNACCSKVCTEKYVASKFGTLAKELNPTRMTATVKAKLREHRLGKGEGVTYSKTYGRHTHRIVAEQILGRPLRPGEVVHHEDENKRNNDPSNLKIFASQAEHAAYHALKKPINPKHAK